jgi:hypothetical protein
MNIKKQKERNKKKLYALAVESFAKAFTAIGGSPDALGLNPFYNDCLQKAKETRK